VKTSPTSSTPIAPNGRTSPLTGQVRLVGRVIALIIGLGLGLAATPEAAAAPPGRLAMERYERLTEEGQVAFQAGRFEDAIKLYLLAYDAVPDPSILYNIGFIYERKLDDPELAIGYYERVATAIDSPPELIAKAENRLGIARELAAEKIRRTPNPRVGDPPGGDNPPSGDPSSNGKGSVKAAPIIVTALGGAAFLGGAIFGSLAVETQVRYAQAREDGLAERARALRDTGRSQALIGDALMIGGGITAAAGLIWFLVDGYDDAPAPASVRLYTTPIRDGAFVMIGGSL
jgi:tetratricopeptide (TPR) repeat protein